MELDKELIKQIKIKPLLDTLKLENISDEEYFSEKYSDYISNSRLGKLVKDGAKSFFEKFVSQEYNPSFFFGSLLHQQYLQPESFEVIEGVYTPTAKARLMALELYHPDGTTPTDDEIKAASYKIGYYKDKLTTNRIKELREKCNQFWRDKFLYEQNNKFKEGVEYLYIDEKSYNLLQECLNSINNNKDFQKLLHPEFLTEEPYSANEQTILLDVEITIPGYDSRIYKLKSKLDNFTIDKEENIITVNDLKTTSRLAKEFDPSFFHYQRELGMYSYLLKLCSEKFFGMNKPTIRGNFLVVSTIPDYNSLVYPMTLKLFKQGFDEFKFLLQTVAYLNIVKGYEFQ
jgi:hypothetical protein